MTVPARNPFVVGQWVRGDLFYGRRRLLDRLLAEDAKTCWILGTRRLGKTSLLRQIEHLSVAEDIGSERVPLYWDLQGSVDSAELQLGLQDALLDAEENLERHGVAVGDLEGMEALAVLERLRDDLSRNGRSLLLLLDEAEELNSLQAVAPDLVESLARLLIPGGGITAYLASSIRLRELTGCGESDGPAPLRDLPPPLSLGPLEPEEAEALVLQKQAPEERRPRFDGSTASDLCRLCGNHPYLLQLLAKRCLEEGSLRQAEKSVIEDRMVARFLEVDFEMLAPAERRLLLDLATEPGEVHAADDDARWPLALGLVARGADGSLEVGNPIFRRWLAELEDHPGRQRDRESPSRGAAAPISAAEVTQLSRVLSARALSRAGGELTPERLAELVYDELRDLARRYMRRERREHTLQPTALVHEAFMKLTDQDRVDWQGRTHFLAVGAQAMRRILIDHARGRGRAKRGAEWYRVPLFEEILPSSRRQLDAEALMDLDRALDRLAADAPRQARVVELRFFAGLEVAEVASILGVSKRTVEGDWARARDHLRDVLATPPDDA